MELIQSEDLKLHYIKGSIMRTIKIPSHFKVVENKKDNMFENRFLDRASDDLYNSLNIDEVVRSVKLSKGGYLIENSGKYNRTLINAVVDYKGFRYGLGIVVDYEQEIILVNSFLNANQTNFSLRNKDRFPRYEVVN